VSQGSNWKELPDFGTNVAFPCGQLKYRIKVPSFPPILSLGPLGKPLHNIHGALKELQYGNNITAA
jgi:hypothetical protein